MGWDGKYLGYLNEYPDHWTQGEDLEDLKAHLRDLYQEFTVQDLPGIKKIRSHFILRESKTVVF